MVSVDYVVIGAGYAGLHCAKRLIEKGFEILIFDMRCVGGELEVFSKLSIFAEEYSKFIEEVQELKKEISVDSGTVIKSKPVIVNSKNGLKRFEARRAILCSGASDTVPVRLNVLRKKMLGIYTLDQSLRILAENKKIGDKILIAGKREAIVELTEKQLEELGYEYEFAEAGEDVQVIGTEKVEGVRVNGVEYKCDTLIFFSGREPFNPLKLKGTPVGNVAVCSYDYSKVEENVRNFLAKLQ
ncbi:MAG: NAD(P)/FAD-dependent oxidoreductase [Archaeoglobaceae archaeon]|nr:NAD(P)/FAD-dependent oxidoreductase [Archaeoglobaceae archaeon]MDW8118337.1 FAD-dependent oxidoreductase [Archaeoglobaceae archaeon]